MWSHRLSQNLCGSHWLGLSWCFFKVDIHVGLAKLSKYMYRRQSHRRVVRRADRR